jgi:hypothetical protein
MDKALESLSNIEPGDCIVCFNKQVGKLCFRFGYFKIFVNGQTLSLKILLNAQLFYAFFLFRGYPGALFSYFPVK